MPASAVESADSVSWESIVVPAGDREVPARVFRPHGPRRGWPVWAHGGGWTRGSVDGRHLACADLTRLAGCTLLSVEYRLAPQHPHPAAPDDVVAVTDWAETQARREDPDGRLVVGGDSSGGTIAACAALAWRDQRRPLAAQVLAYPPLDPWCRAGSYTRHASSFPTRAGMIAAWRSYRGATAGTGAPVYSTPFEAEDLRGLAPAVLGAGELDPVADDVHACARRLRAAGNTVELREFPGMGHGSFLQSAVTVDGVLVENPLRYWLGTTFRSLLLARITRGRAAATRERTARRTSTHHKENQ